MQKQLKSIFISALLAGCAVGPDYKEPKIELPSAFSEPETAEELTVAWWTVFNDKQLNELIELAVQENKSVKQALSRLNRSRSLSELSRANLLPGYQLEANYNRSKNAAFGFPGEGSDSFEVEVYSGGVAASWEIDIFGRLRRQVEADKAGVQESSELLKDAIRLVSSEVAQAYLGYCTAAKQLAVIKKNLKAQERSLEIVRSKFELGESSKLALMQAQASYYQTRALLPDLESQAKLFQNQLALLLGRSSVSVNDNGIPMPSSELLISNPQSLLQRRPDVRAAERALARQTALIGVAVANLYPTITITGGIGREAENISPLSLSTEVYRILPGISWTPLNTGRLTAVVDQREAETEEALLYWEETVLRALKEVEDALARYSASTQRVVEIEEALKAADEALSISQKQYAEGIVDYLLVLDTQRTALETENALAEGRKELALSTISLYSALGYGWEVFKLEAS